jgi:hypothetical protein
VPRSISTTLDVLRALSVRISDLDSPYPLKPATFAEPASTERLASLEKVTGPLPRDYREFLSACGGIIAMDFFNGYHVFDPGLVESHFDQDYLPRFIDTDGATTRVLSVAGDGGGNLFLLERDEPFRVWKWNHELGAATAPTRHDHRSLFLIAQTFSGFLERVAEDWTHFVKNDTKWTYISG